MILDIFCRVICGFVKVAPGQMLALFGGQGTDKFGFDTQEAENMLCLWALTWRSCFWFICTDLPPGQDDLGLRQHEVKWIKHALNGPGSLWELLDLLVFPVIAAAGRARLEKLLQLICEACGPFWPCRGLNMISTSCHRIIAQVLYCFIIINHKKILHFVAFHTISKKQ